MTSEKYRAISLRIPPVQCLCLHFLPNFLKWYPLKFIYRNYRIWNFFRNSLSNCFRHFCPGTRPKKNYRLLLGMSKSTYHQEFLRDLQVFFLHFWKNFWKTPGKISATIPEEICKGFIVDMSDAWAVLKKKWKNFCISFARKSWRIRWKNFWRNLCMDFDWTFF